MSRTACIETFGCQMNVHDSERVAGLLEQAGYELTDDATSADLVVINTCSVRERAQDKLFSRLENLVGAAKPNRPLIAVIGCVAQQEGSRILNRSPDVDVVVGTQALKRLPVLVEEAKSSEQPQIDINPYDDVSFPLGIAIRNDPVKAYVTIIEGCNDFCSFCVVPYTRGIERMRSSVEIIEEVKKATDMGCREISLLGQIVNHYQDPNDSSCDFSDLLHRISDIDGVDRIRFSSPHPRHVTRRMLEAIASLPKVCRHLHLPVQSGSSEILRAMRRRHTRQDYLGLVDLARDIIPKVTLSTDVIVGFPGETEEQFDETLSLASSVKYHSMFSFKYSERPNTLAASRLPDTVTEIDKARRLEVLQRLQKGIQANLNAQQVGQTLEVLVDSRSRKRANEFSGRTSGNTVVNFPGSAEWIGKLVQVKVERSGPNSLWGRPESSNVN